MLKNICLIFLICCLSACSFKGNTPNNRAKDFALHDIWALESIGEKAVKNLNDNRPTLELYVNEMRMSGNDGCNNIFGGLAILDDTHLKFDMIASTLMACPDMTEPYQFTQTLDHVRKYKRVGLNLFLLDEEGTPLLKFKKVD